MVVGDGERVLVVVRIVYDVYNPLYVPVEVGANRNAPHITTIPTDLWLEWHMLKARQDELQKTLKARYEQAETDGE